MSALEAVMTYTDMTVDNNEDSVAVEEGEEEEKKEEQSKIEEKDPEMVGETEGEETKQVEEEEFGKGQKGQHCSVIRAQEEP